MKQLKLFTSFNEPELAVEECNKWIADKTKAAEKAKTTFEHGEPQATAVGNRFIITVSYTL